MEKKAGKRYVELRAKACPTKRAPDTRQPTLGQAAGRWELKTMKNS
jgi:hypothetical protein